MEVFVLGDDAWAISCVPEGSDELLDDDGVPRLGMTDVSRSTVYISDALGGYERQTVLIHEIAHCALTSLGLRDELERFARPERLEDAEEWVCNLFADYGLLILDTAFDLLGEDAWMEVPPAYERLAG